MLSPGSPDNQTIGISWNEGTQRGSLQKRLPKEEQRIGELDDSQGVIEFRGADSDDATDPNEKTPSKNSHNKNDKSGKSDIEIVQEEQSSLDSA